MSKPEFSSLRIALLVTDGFEQEELTTPRDFLVDLGVKTELIAPDQDNVTGVNHGQPGDNFTVDRHLEDISGADYHALVLPGGLANPDSLRLDKRATNLVREIHDQGKLVAAICHGPWLLAEADVVRGKKVTSWPSLKTDLENAGATWVDTELQVDGNLLTSRKPADLEAFCHGMKRHLNDTVLAWS